jgi:hypothetical protein
VKSLLSIYLIVITDFVPEKVTAARALSELLEEEKRKHEAD